jgi:multiple sugar transport system permease protein
MATATVAAAPAVRTEKAPGIKPRGWIGFLFIAPNLLGVIAFT